MLLKIVPRDYILMQQISKWRFLLGRQIKILAEFPSQRTVDRRIKILKEAGYIKGAYKLYGVPALYFATNKAKNVFNLDFVTTDVKIARIVHDIAVVDTAIYFMKKLKVVNIKSEREFRHDSGFKRDGHYPDFICNIGSATYAVEIEMTVKNKNVLENNIKKNYLSYDNQVWVVPKDKTKIWTVLEKSKNTYSNIFLISLEEVSSYVKTL